jgi:hypothetical protein
MNETKEYHEQDDWQSNLDLNPHSDASTAQNHVSAITMTPATSNNEDMLDLAHKYEPIASVSSCTSIGTDTI